MVTEALKNAFWAAVADCLARFHGIEPQIAKARTFELRQTSESPPPGIDADLVYHAEPFDVACRVAGHDLDLAAFRASYDEILSNRFGPAREEVTAAVASRVQRRPFG